MPWRDTQKPLSCWRVLIHCKSQSICELETHYTLPIEFKRLATLTKKPPSSRVLQRIRQLMVRRYGESGIHTRLRKRRMLRPLEAYNRLARPNQQVSIN